MSRRLEILQALEVGLKTINKANGFLEDVLEVSRKFRHWSETKNFIRINIITGRETFASQTQQIVAAVNWTDRFEISLLSYVKVPMDTQDEGLGSNIAENHIADIKRYLYENPTLGLDFLIEFVPDSVDGFLDWAAQIQIIEINCHAMFQWQGLNP